MALAMYGAISIAPNSAIWPEFDTFPKKRYYYNMRLFQNFSFGTASLDLREKPGLRPVFPRAKKAPRPVARRMAG
jgi:hypothetical protein